MASKVNGTDVSDWARAPPKGSFGQRFLRAIYNPEEKSFFGRTAKRWGIAVLFYAVFYAVLAAMFAVCMGGLFLTLDDSRPMFTLDQSLIGANPGVAFRPIPADGAVVQLNRTNSSAADAYVLQLHEFFQPYENESWLSDVAECVGNDTFGFPDSPCFFIKLNKIFDWEPNCYDVESLPAEMPEDLVDHIKSLPPIKQKQVWISCEEEKGKNTTQLVMPWSRGFPNIAYPFTNQPGYLSPLVAVRMFGVPVNTVVTIRCRAWAKNIMYNKSIKDARGYARIQFKIVDEFENNEPNPTE